MTARQPTWGDDPPRSALREWVGIVVLIVAFWGSLVGAAYVDLGAGR